MQLIKWNEQPKISEEITTFGWIALIIIPIGIIIAIYTFGNILGGIVIFVGLLILLTQIKINKPYQETVILRLGKFRQIAKEGPFFLYPILDKGYRVDTRVISTTFIAEQTLTKDNIPTNIDAILFWKVCNVNDAVLKVQNFEESIKNASMTALREAIGKENLAEVLSNREIIDSTLQKVIESKAKNWGVEVDKVEIKDIKIPQGLQDAMSRQAQAERERQARVILGESEVQVAKKFSEASEQYKNNPEALHLRGMNMLFESVKEGTTIIIVPSSAVDTMGFGNIAGLTTALKENKKTDSTGIT